MAQSLVLLLSLTILALSSWRAENICNSLLLRERSLRNKAGGQGAEGHVEIPSRVLLYLVLLHRGAIQLLHALLEFLFNRFVAQHEIYVDQAECLNVHQSATIDVDS